MRNIRKIILIIYGLFIVLMSISINTYNPIDSSNRFNDDLRTNGYWDLPPIFINGSATGFDAYNWSWVEDQIWFGGGNGTLINPYIIENITIDGQNSGSCIKVVDSNVYFRIRNCTLFNSGKSYPDGGITLMNVNNSVIFNNTCSFDNYYGIVLDNCFNNTIQENFANNNTLGGIGVAYSNEIKILENNADYNNYYGLQLYQGYDFLVENNVFNYNKDDGINSLWVNSSVVINNTLRYNTVGGIEWNNAYYNNFSGNLIANNEHSGFNSYNFRTGYILENEIYENSGYGIYLWSPDPQKINENSTIEGNKIIGNIYGLGIGSYHNNTIRDNIVKYNEKDGMIIYSQFNRIFNNTVSYNYESGMVIERSNNFIFKNTILFNYEDGIYSWYNSHLNNISNNIINYNNEYGIRLVKSTNNTIVFNEISHNYGGVFIEKSNYNDIIKNNINYNYQEGIYLSRSNNSEIIQNRLFGNEVCILEFECENNYFEDNDCSITSTDIFVEILTQSFTSEKFNITFLIYNSLGQGIDFATILLWWNGVDVSNDVINLGNGLYFISLESITVALNEDPILLNMTVSAIGYKDKYFETYIAVEPPEVPEPCEIVKHLNVEITENSYSLQHFNLTWFIYNETEHGIDSATIQMWWNGTDVSDDVINLGKGLYFISLDPITVAAGEDPILLSIDISASGYEDKHFETYLAVDPDILEKGIEQGGAEFPLLILIIALISAAGGIGATLITIGILRKRRPTKEGI